MKKTALTVVVVVVLSLLSMATVFFGATAVRFLWRRPVVVRGNSMLPTLAPDTVHYSNTMATPKVGDVAFFYYVPDTDRPQQTPSALYYGANAFWRCMPIVGGRVQDTYSQGYELVVKRVVAVGGDVVELRAETVDGVERVYLWRNGERVQEDVEMLNFNATLPATMAYAEQHREDIEQHRMALVRPEAAYTVPEDCYYVLGDNRDNSRDSRSFGAVSAAFFVGVLVR